MATAKQFLALAAPEIGTLEGYDNVNGWNNRVKYTIWYGIIGAWCGMFVSWVAWRLGILGTVVPKYASCWSGLKWFRDRKQTGYWPPQPGDIFIMCDYEPDKAGAWNDTTGTGWLTAHTGIVEKYLGDGWFQTIEGNTNTSGSSQGNGVYRLKRRDSANSNRFIFCRPKWDPEPVVVAPTPVPTSFNLAPIKMDMSVAINVGELRPKNVDKAVARLKSAIWNWRGTAFRASVVKTYKLTTRAQIYDPTYNQMTIDWVQAAYSLLHKMEPTKGWLTKDQAAGRAELPTWPGPAFLRRIGFKQPYNY